MTVTRLINPAKVDRKGTCHRVGCVGKGVHALTEPCFKDIPVTHTPANIGAPDSWTPYEGGPLIPKPHSYCLGYVKLVIDATTKTSWLVCSIAGEQAWGLLLTSGQFNMATFVDAHKRDCPNRVVR